MQKKDPKVLEKRFETIKRYIHMPRDTLCLPQSPRERLHRHTSLAINNLGWWLCPEHVMYPNDALWDVCHTLGWCVVATKEQRDIILEQDKTHYTDVINGNPVAYLAHPMTQATCFYIKDHEAVPCMLTRLNYIDSDKKPEEIWERSNPVNPKALQRLKIWSGYANVVRKQGLMAKMQLKEEGQSRTDTETGAGQSDPEKGKNVDEQEQSWKAYWYCLACSVDAEEGRSDIPKAKDWRLWAGTSKNPHQRPPGTYGHYQLVDITIDGIARERYCWVNSFGGESLPNELDDGMTCHNTKYSRGIAGLEHKICGWRYRSLVPWRWEKNERGFDVCVRDFDSDARVEDVYH